MLLRCLSTAHRLGLTTARVAIAVIGSTRDSAQHTTTTPTPPANRTLTTTDIDALFAELGDLGDGDGLKGLQEQRIMEGRNSAILLAEFYKTLIKRGIPDFTAHELIQMYYNRVMEEDELGAEMIVSSYDEDDD